MGNPVTEKQNILQKHKRFLRTYVELMKIQNADLVHLMSTVKHVCIRNACGTFVLCGENMEKIEFTLCEC